MGAPARTRKGANRTKNNARNRTNGGLSNNARNRTNGGLSNNARNRTNGGLSNNARNRTSVGLSNKANVGRGAMPMSGSESTFSNQTFGSSRGKGNNNCYAWALDMYRDGGGVKLQPGDLSKASRRRNVDLGTCASLRERALADMKGRGYAGRGYAVNPDAPCRRGYYKIMGFIDPNNDHHWYRQHRDVLMRTSGRPVRDLARNIGIGANKLLTSTNAPHRGDLVLADDAGLWSHKRGFATAPLLRDSCGKLIRDPRTACRNYGDLNYTQFCGAFCVQPASRSAQLIGKLAALKREFRAFKRRSVRS